MTLFMKVRVFVAKCARVPVQVSFRVPWFWFCLFLDALRCQVGTFVCPDFEMGLNFD